METFLGFLIMGSFVWLLFGLISPARAIFWARKRTRLRVLGWYAIFFLVMLVVIQIFAPQPSQPQAEQATPTPEVAPASAPPQPESQSPVAPAKQPEPVAAEATASTPTVDAAKLAEEQAARVKTSVRLVRKDLLAADLPGSDAADFARSMLQKVGKGVSLGDVYGAFKAANLAADESFSRLMQYRVPQDLPKDVRAKLDEAHKALRSVAMLRGQVAESIMDWLDTRKPSLENAAREKSNLITLAMTQAIISLTEAMQAAGLSDDEVKAELAEMAGNEKTGRVKSGK